MKRHIILIVAFFLAAALIGIRASKTRLAGPDAADILRKAAERRHALCYSGVVRASVLYGRRTVSILTSIQHTPTAERVEYLSRPLTGMIMVSNAGKRRTYRPDLKRILVSCAPSHESCCIATENLLKNYGAAIVGEDKIAGREAYVVQLTPRYRGNPSKDLWIDKRTYLILASSDKTSSGAERSRMRFEKVSYDRASCVARPDLPRLPSVVVERPLSREEIPRRFGFSILLPRYVPRGYKLDGFRLYNCECDCGHKYAVVRYTDGLNSLSVFEARRSTCTGGGCARPNASTDCRVSDCRLALLGQRIVRGINIAVVADLPQEEIRRIANSVR